jgi:dTDP-4-amino-4,6-dideoxygalactose transaminase
MSEASAAMGLAGLESLDEFIELNRHNYELYNKGLNATEGIKVIRYSNSEKHNYQYIVIEIEEATVGLSRDEIQKVLWAENILARRYFYPGCHRMEPYRSYFPHAHLLLPETERVSRRVLTLPTGDQIAPDQIEIICSIIRTAAHYAEHVRERLKTK